MDKPVQTSERDGGPQSRLSLVFALMLAAGMCFAAVQAWYWPGVVRPRNLIVVGPESAELHLSGDPVQLSVTNGIYAWSVSPGPYTLKVTRPDFPVEKLDLEVPRGLGGLMLEIKQGPNGELLLGYF